MSVFNPNEYVFRKLKRAGKRMPKELFVCEEKLDGESYMLMQGAAYGRGISTVTHRRENKWEGLPPWIKDQAQPDLLVHGELHVEGGTSSDVKSALCEGRDSGWDSDLAKRLRFTAHNIVHSNAGVLVQRDKLRSLGFEVPRALRIMSAKEGTWKLTSHWNNTTTPVLDTGMATTEQLIEIAKQEGIEGWVLKELGSSGKWWKLKVTWDYDCVVMGTKDGKGQFYGDVGALKVGMFEDTPSTGNTSCRQLVEVARCSGMTEEERAWMTQHRNELVGKVCVVTANGVCSLGRLHHPRFVRWRDDKPAHECTIDQLEEKR